MHLSGKSIKLDNNSGDDNETKISCTPKEMMAKKKVNNFVFRIIKNLYIFTSVSLSLKN